MASTTIRDNLTGTFTRDQLQRLTWPIAWSGTVPASEQADEEAALRTFARDAIAAIEEAELHLGGAMAAKVESGEIVEIVEIVADED
jgi:hypothetical protein